MVVVLEAGSIKRWRGLSTDEKPRFADESNAAIPVGAIFTELDTGQRFVWGGTWPWVRQEQTIEALFAALMDVNEQILVYLKAIHQGHELHLWGANVEVDSF